MLSFDFCLRSLMNVPPPPFVFRHAVRRPYAEQGCPLREEVALVGHKLAKIKLMVQRRKRVKKPISAGN
jgi:hypothetical protein